VKTVSQISNISKSKMQKIYRCKTGVLSSADFATSESDSDFTSEAEKIAPRTAIVLSRIRIIPKRSGSNLIQIRIPYTDLSPSIHFCDVAM
jgi:hypothetical protein